MSLAPDLFDHPLVSWGQSVDDVVRRTAAQVYLATPYTRRVAPGGAFQLRRSRAVADEAAALALFLARRGVSAVSPIVQAHAMVAVLHGRVYDRALAEFALDAAFWTRWCRPLLEASRAVYVPELAGWDESDGIAHEIAAALAAGKPVLIGAHAHEVRA